jgi:exoribonuclease R
MARYASRASSDYHTYQFFKGKNTIERGIVTAIDEDSVTIMLIKYGLESRIKLSAKDMVESKGLNIEGGIACRVNIEGRVLSLFEYVDVEVRVELVGFHKLINLRIV